MTDRDMMEAVFKAVAIVHRHLTGKRLEVCVETDDGLVIIYDNGLAPGELPPEAPLSPAGYRRESLPRFP